jgi:hypothetical protein
MGYLLKLDNGLSAFLDVRDTPNADPRNALPPGA